MWIKNLVLNNIQSYKDQRIELSRHINLIVGKNNSGKSSILRSLLVFQSGGYLKAESLLRKFEDSGFILATTEEMTRKTSLKDIPADSMSCLLFEAPENTITNPIISSPLRPSGELKALFKKLHSNQELPKLGQFPDTEPNNILIPFLAKRKPQYFNGNFDEASIAKIDHDLRNLTSKLSRAQGNTLKKKFEKACEDIIGFVPAILPGVHNQTHVVQYVGPNETILLDQMGDGVSQILGFLLSLFQEKNKIFLIEEIENDLHPAALKQVLDLILKASQHNQFIISTHSNIVMRLLGSHEQSKIFETSSTMITDEQAETALFESKVKEIENTPDERIRILGELGYELLDFHMFEGYLILEESSAEKLVREFLIPAFCPKLVNRLGTIAAKGASDVSLRFSLLQSLFTYIHKTQAYHNKAWICVDGDDEGKKAIEKCKNGFSNRWESKFFQNFSKTNFEEFYPQEYNDKIAVINKEKDRKQKGVLKLNLASDVVKEYRSAPDTVKARFESSASEVINLLGTIERELLPKS